MLDRLSRGWSPEQIAGRLDRIEAAARISYESIYRFIYDEIRRTNDGSWRLYLPRAKYKRGRRRPTIVPPINLIKGRVSIALRPAEVELRNTFGHWEGDLMLFTAPGQAILVSQERKSRAILSTRQPGKTALPHRPASVGFV